MGCRLWGRTESDTTEATQQQQARVEGPQLCLSYCHFVLSHPFFLSFLPCFTPFFFLLPSYPPVFSHSFSPPIHPTNIYSGVIKPSEHHKNTRYINFSNKSGKIRYRVERIFGEGNGTPLQYSCLENPMGGGAWWAAVYGVAQSRTRLKRLSSSSSSREDIAKSMKTEKFSASRSVTVW